MTTEKITSLTQLRAWQEARILAVTIYKISARFPAEEKFGLTSQVRRSAVSVAANIAEGFSRGGARNKIQFYTIALGSLTETLSHSYIAFDLGYIHKEDLDMIENNVTNVQKMTNGLTKSAQSRNPQYFIRTTIYL